MAGAVAVPVVGVLDDPNKPPPVAALVALLPNAGGLAEGVVDPDVGAAPNPNAGLAAGVVEEPV